MRRSSSVAVGGNCPGFVDIYLPNLGSDKFGKLGPLGSSLLAPPSKTSKASRQRKGLSSSASSPQFLQHVGSEPVATPSPMRRRRPARDSPEFQPGWSRVSAGEVTLPMVQGGGSVGSRHAPTTSLQIGHRSSRPQLEHRETDAGGRGERLLPELASPQRSSPQPRSISGARRYEALSDGVVDEAFSRSPIPHTGEGANQPAKSDALVVADRSKKSEDRRARRAKARNMEVSMTLEGREEWNALQEISSTAASIAGSLEQVIKTFDKLGADSDAESKVQRMLYEASFGDPVYLQARQAMAQSSLATDVSKTVLPRPAAPTSIADEAPTAMQQVSEEMSRQNLESWASGVLRAVPTSPTSPIEERGEADASDARSADDNPAPPPLPPIALRMVTWEDEVEAEARKSAVDIDGKDRQATSEAVPDKPPGRPDPETPKAATAEGVAQAEAAVWEGLDVPRLQTAFRRFKVPDSGDLHKGDLMELLSYLGHVMVDEEKIDPIIKQVTLYEYLDWEEFLYFMDKYVPFEQEQFQRVFEEFDVDGNREICLKELWQLLAALGFMPLRGMVQEALQDVDRDSDGQLGFVELVHFLRVYRAQEGFTKDEVKDLHASFMHFAQARDGEAGLPADKLGEALVKTFGLHIQAFAKELEDMLKGGQGLQKNASFSPTRGGRTEVLLFPEFLIFARKVREAALEKLKTDFPAWVQACPQHKVAQQEFAANDTDGSGGISEVELRRALKKIGYTPLRQNMMEIFAEVIDGPWYPGRELDFHQFFGFMLVVRQREGFSIASVDFMRKVFDRFDDDSSGEVSALELSELFRHLGYKADMDAIHVFVTQVDANNSGDLDFREFLRLMRFHREAEISKYLEAFTAHRKDPSAKPKDDDSISGKEVFKALQELDLEPTKVLRLMPNALPERGLAFDAFIDVVDSCRLEYVQKQRRNASFSDEKVQFFQDFFNRFDKDRSGDISRMELEGILRHFGWEPRSSEEQVGLMKKLDMARARAKEAGVQTTASPNDICFWTFLQLARMLETEQEHVEEERLNRLMAELHFSTQEVAQFREIYCERKSLSADDGGPSPTALESSLKPSNTGDMEPTGLSREAIRKLMRILVVTINPDEKNKLDEQLKDLMNDDGFLDFHGFLRLMRWLLGTDFAGINARLAKKAEQVV